MSKKDTNKLNIYNVAIVVFSIGLIIFMIISAFYMKRPEAVSSVSRNYDCDYGTFNLKTKITTKINNKTVTIAGNIFKIVTDPLTMKDDNDNVIGYATDTYRFIGQDAHSIIVNNNVEAILDGNFSFFGTSYDLYDADGNTVGYAKFNLMHTRGYIANNKDEMIAKYDRFIFFNDYTVTIYENDVCSDEAILMMVASYISDYHGDLGSSSNSNANDK